MELRKAEIVMKGSNGESVSVNVEVAESDAQRQRGLMFRDQLNANAGMLFIFDQPQGLSFWMKNTRIPLDIIFLDEHRRYVSSATMTPCIVDPCMTYQSAGPAMYALEVTQGFIKKNAVGPGSRLEHVPEY